MGRFRFSLIGIICVASIIGTRTGYAQMFKPQVDFSFGVGGNVSYFSIGNGTPGLSLSTNTFYQWNSHWKAGANIGVHNVVGTDEGTANYGRGLAYDSYIYEFSGRVEYLFYFSSSWNSRWKQKINPMLPYGGTWKRRIKPFLFAGAGMIHYKPYTYTYPNNAPLDENPPYPSLAALLKGGFGVYYFLNRFVSFSLEAGTNLPLSRYTEHIESELIEKGWDMFHVISVRFIFSLPVL